MRESDRMDVCCFWRWVANRASRTMGVTALWMLVCACAGGAATAQEVTPPERGEPIESIGLPQLWRPEIAGAFRWDREGDDDAYGVELTGSLFRPRSENAFKIIRRVIGWC